MIQGGDSLPVPRYSTSSGPLHPAASSTIVPSIRTIHWGYILVDARAVMRQVGRDLIHSGSQDVLWQALSALQNSTKK